MHKLPEKPPSDWVKLLELDESQFVKIPENPKLQQFVNEINSRYLFWDELRYRIKDADQRKVIWAFVKLIRLLRFERIPFKCLDLKYSLIPEIVRNLHTIDRYLSGTIQIHNKTIRLEQSYIINSLMEEAIASSILEGAATTRKAAKDMLRRGRKPKNTAEQMVLNNYEALQFVLEKKDQSLTSDLLLDIHRIVTRGTLDEQYIGNYRTDNEVVVSDAETGLVYHTPPEYSQIDAFIREICRFANEDIEKKPGTEEFIHPVIRGIILHYLIGYLHPFTDGNGRTARSVFYWYVLRSGYWLFEYMPISRVLLHSKKKYGLAYLYTEYDDQDLTYFLKYNLASITRAIGDLLTYLERKQSEQNATKAIIKTFKDLNPRQAEILRHMMEHSDEYFTIRQIMQMYGVVYQTARIDLLTLERHGYVTMVKRGREFMFIFNEKSDLWHPENTRGASRTVNEDQKQLGDFSTG